MNASRIGAIVLRMFYLYRGSPQRIFPIFIFVAIDVLVWGFLTRYLNSVSHADFNFVPALLGAVLLWDFLTRVMQQLTAARQLWPAAAAVCGGGPYLRRDRAAVGSAFGDGEGENPPGASVAIGNAGDW